MPFKTRSLEILHNTLVIVLKPRDRITELCDTTVRIEEIQKSVAYLKTSLREEPAFLRVFWDR